MQVRKKLRATMVHELGSGELTDTVSAASMSRTIGADRVTTAAAESLPVEGDVVGGQYRLTRTIGEGMFGRVYEAERTDVPEHRVALKVINREVYAERDVERELVMLAAAGHPNIVELKDHGVTDDHVWLTMPLYVGETLAERLGRGTLTVREAYDIFVPIARGVEALHARGLRHQDIKPENIFLADFAGQLHPVLLDLGVAAEKNASFVAGTVLYAAPEQLAMLSGAAEADELSEKIDTYCLASTLLYALVGEKHYPGVKARTPFDIVTAFEDRETAPLAAAALPDLDGEPRRRLAAALSRWLTREPAERPTAGELAAELSVLLEQEREEVRAADRRVARQKAALQRVRIALAALAIAAMAAGFYVYSKRKAIALATELQQARAEGKASFEELDTCQAAHDLSQRDTRRCEDERKADAAQHQRVVMAAKTKGDQDLTVLSDRLTSAQQKLSTCEEDSAAIKKERAELEQSLTDQSLAWDERRAELEQERDTADKARRTCEDSSAQHEQKLQVCNQALASCQGSGRDIYAGPALTAKPSLVPPSKPPPAPPPPGSPYPD